MDVPMRGLGSLGQHHGFYGEGSHPEKQMERTNLIWDGRRRTTWVFLCSKTTGCRSPNDCLLEISLLCFSCFIRSLEIKGCTKHIFMHAGQITDYDWKVYLSPHRIESRPYGQVNSGVRR